MQVWGVFFHLLRYYSDIRTSIKDNTVNKNTLAAIIFASFSATIMPVQAIDIDPAAQGIIDTAIQSECIPNTETPKKCDITGLLATAITDNPALAESLVAAALASVGDDAEAAEAIIASAIATLGADSPLIASILQIATEAGVDSDTVTVIAIENGVDATIASEATAAGNNVADITAVNTGTSNLTDAGGGGGGGGISENL